MRKTINILLLGALVALSISACGITGNKRFHPGYARFDFPGSQEADRVMGLSFGALPLRFAAWVADEDLEPETADMLRSLKGVRVYIYELDQRGRHRPDYIHRTGNQLQKQGWETLVKVNEDQEQTYVMMRMDRGGIAGLTVMASDGEEAVFVNLIGNIRPEMFGEVIAKLDVGVDVDIPEEELALAEY